MAGRQAPIPWSYRPLLPGLAFLAIIVLLSLDLVEDWRAGSTPTHIAVEGLVMIFAVAGVVASAVVVVQDARDTRVKLVVARAQAQEAVGRSEELGRQAASWRAEAEGLLRGLGEAIDGQFSTWGLTPAEREVSLFLLKGLSTKEIAAARRTSDQTVRQQARAIYAKAGLSGRAELAAFFLEDLLLPPQADSQDAATTEG